MNDTSNMVNYGDRSKLTNLKSEDRFDIENVLIDESAQQSKLSNPTGSEPRELQLQEAE